MKAAIYARVSTEDQEREGTSLDSQVAACVGRANELGYDTDDEHIIREVWSGLTLERPKLSQLREWVRNKEIDALFAYTLDRLSRDPVHFIILLEQIERAGVELVLVTETLDSSDLGKLITHIKGYAAKLEAAKIRERTMRGIRERVKAGKLPSGQRGRLFGYTYMPGRGVGEGVRYINEDQAKWVREIYRWHVEEGLTLNAITYRLRALNVPTPSGRPFWIRSTVYKILTNPAYIGKTYCFVHVHKETTNHHKDDIKSRKTAIQIKPYEEGVEIPGATPPIIDENLFAAAQARLKQNKGQPNREGKVKFLLRGHIHCSRCGRKYWGYCRWVKGQPSSGRRYYCMGRRTIITPDKCDNKGYDAAFLETVVWQQVEKLLSQPELILGELSRRRGDAEGQTLWEQRLRTVEVALAGWDKKMDNLAHAAVLGLPEERFKKQLDDLNKQKAELEVQKAELERKIKESKQAKIDMEKVEQFCTSVKQNLASFSFQEKKLALEALRIKLWINGDQLTIEGAVPLPDSAAPSTPPSWRR
jgi:site-specific DNA recombinase